APPGLTARGRADLRANPRPHRIVGRPGAGGPPRPEMKRPVTLDRNGLLPGLPRIPPRPGPTTGIRTDHPRLDRTRRAGTTARATKSAHRRGPHRPGSRTQRARA